MKKKIILSISIVLNLSTVNTYACSCIATSEEQRYQNAHKVFLGTVVETKLFTKTENVDELELSTKQVTAKIKITKAVKGETAEHINLVDNIADGANCAVGLMTGRDYLFYLNDTNLLSLCDGTRLYNDVTDQELIETMLSY